jgi:hypothetical protein
MEVKMRRSFENFATDKLLSKRLRLIKKLDSDNRCMSNVIDLANIENELVIRGVDIVLWCDY